VVKNETGPSFNIKVKRSSLDFNNKDLAIENEKDLLSNIINNQVNQVFGVVTTQGNRRQQLQLKTYQKPALPRKDSNESLIDDGKLHYLASSVHSRDQRNNSSLS
jgi:hypothetical protein